MKYVVVDIEADGPIPGKYSMISLGAVALDDLSKTFYTEIRPISEEWVPEALNVSGFTRKQTLKFPFTATDAMQNFRDWLGLEVGGSRFLFVSDNAGFDWMFVCWYFHQFLGENPFGHSPASITWLYKGLARNTRADFRKDGLRQRRHTHNALDDALGNAEALLKMRDKGLKL